jgi:hypothetical protein
VKSTVKKKKRGTIYHTDSEEEEISFSWKKSGKILMKKVSFEIVPEEWLGFW